MRFWEVLGGPNGSKNRILKGFLQCFFRVRSGIDFVVIIFCFFRGQTLIFVRTASVLEDFYRIEGFFKNSKKTLILDTFSEAEAEKNQEKIVLRNLRFLDIDFLAFFFDFQRFAWILGRPGPSKNFKK